MQLSSLLRKGRERNCAKADALDSFFTDLLVDVRR